MLPRAQTRAVIALLRQLAPESSAEAGRPSPRPLPGPGDVPDAVVRKHLIAPLAYRAGASRFRTDYVASALLADLRAQHLEAVTHALTQAGVALALIKGAAYLGNIYPDPAERPMSDVDVLVPPGQHAHAAQVLRRLGMWRVGSPRQISRLHHAVGYKRKGISIDLHRSMVQPFRSRIDLAAIWLRARPIAGLRGQYQLDPVDELVLHLAHIARHELMVPAINYIDAARLAARVPIAEVYARAQQFRLARAVRAALAMTRALTGLPPAGVGSPLARSARQPVSALTDAVLPSAREVLGYRPVWRPLQVARKMLLVDGPSELAGLLAVGVYDGLVHRVRT